MRPSWWTGSLEVAQSRPQRPLAIPVGTAWTCAAASPAFLVGLAAMVAVIANRFVRGLSGPIRRSEHFESIHAGSGQQAQSYWQVIYYC